MDEPVIKQTPNGILISLTNQWLEDNNFAFTSTPVNQGYNVTINRELNINWDSFLQGLSKWKK